MEESEFTIEAMLYSIIAVIDETFPHRERFDWYPYSMGDLAAQIIFELIKEEYKNTAPKHSLQHYIKSYDWEANNRKYTRAVQYIQSFRDDNNASIENEVGIRLPELEAPSMNGAERFWGYDYNLCEFLQIKLQAECKLPNKLHGGQISNSKKVSEQSFQDLFELYSSAIDAWKPKVTEENNADDLIGRIMAYYDTETYFLCDFMYKTTLIAEQNNYPKEIPVDLLLDTCSVLLGVPGAEWCPGSHVATLFIIKEWDKMVELIYASDNETRSEISAFLLDCKRLMGRMLRPETLEGLLSAISKCSTDDKLTFLKNNFWFWDYRPQYEWNSDRIRYFRKLSRELRREFGNPHIK